MDTFEMYKELLNMSPNELNSASFRNFSKDDEDDVETFITSEDLVKRKELLKNRKELKGDMIKEEDKDDAEGLHCKLYSKVRVHKYTETEMKMIRESCLATVVHDYDEFDIYHLSDEERNKNDLLEEIAPRLYTLKRTYRKIDKFIEAMRIVYEAWNILERNNYVHTREEFFELVSSGKIISNRIIMPKMKGLNKYNLDALTTYISNPELDLSHLVKEEKELDEEKYSFYRNKEGNDKEDLEEKRVLTQEEIKAIDYFKEHPDEIVKMKISGIKRKWIKGYDNRNVKRKKENKRNKSKRESLSLILNKFQNSIYYKQRGSYFVTNSMFDVDEEDNNMWDDLYFSGSWADDEEVALYDLAVREEMLKQRPPRERYLTYGDKEMEKFFNTLEDNGINTLEFRRRMGESEGTLLEKREKMSNKDNKKIEAAVLQRIIKLNQNTKFKRLIKKAEDALVEYREGEK
jgi:hypothetical protein